METPTSERGHLQRWFLIAAAFPIGSLLVLAWLVFDRDEEQPAPLPKATPALAPTPTPRPL